MEAAHRKRYPARLRWPGRRDHQESAGHAGQRSSQLLQQNLQVIGTHPGTSYFTIGERVGERIEIKIIPEYRNKVKGKIYVAKKTKNSLIVAPENHSILKTKSIKIKDLHLINPKEKIPNSVKARIRHLGRLISGKLKKEKQNYTFTFSKPQEGVAEGQFIVLYSGEKLIGCGEIRSI